MRISDWSSDVCSSDLGTIVYAPPPAEKADDKPETLRKRAWQRRREPAALKEWRERMASEPGQQVYARRRPIETVNGPLKNHGLARLILRGLAQNPLALHPHAHPPNIPPGPALAPPNS